MPQRPEDYQSTLNRGGNKLGGTGAGHNDPFAYVKIKPEHAHLGHFRREKFLRMGHNQSGLSRANEKLGRRAVRRALTRQVKAGNVGVAQALAADRPVIAAKLARRHAVKQARRAGESVKAVRQKFKGVVQAARQSPESRRGERQARRIERRPKTSAGRLGASVPKRY